MQRDRGIAIVAALGAAIGIGAELVSGASIARSAADLTTGWTLLGCGLWGWRAGPDQLRWVLLAAAGLAWFAGNFADAGAAGVSSIGGALIYLHRAPLVHATISGARSRSPLRPGFVRSSCSSTSSFPTSTDSPSRSGSPPPTTRRWSC